MEGVAGPAAIDPGGHERQRRRRRRLHVGIGIVVVCAAAAAGLGVGLRYGRGTIGRSSSSAPPDHASYPIPSSFTTPVDSGIKNNMGPLPSPQRSPIGDATGSPGTSSGKTGSATDKKNGDLASILAAASSAVAGVGNPLAPSSGAGGDAPPPDTPAFLSLQGRLSSGVLGLRTCYPRNGTEVVAMSSGSNPCTVLILTKSSQSYYAIRQTINITTPKVFIGNPIDPPVLNATRIERLFDGASILVCTPGRI